MISRTNNKTTPGLNDVNGTSSSSSSSSQPPSASPEVKKFHGTNNIIAILMTRHRSLLALMFGLVFVLRHRRPEVDIMGDIPIPHSEKTAATAAKVIPAIRSKLPACPIDTNRNVTSRHLRQVWKDIDKQVSKFPKTRVSGGIFLYPRQTALITSLVEFLGNAIDDMEEYEGRGLTICETGFGAGHSAAMFLDIAKNINNNRNNNDNDNTANANAKHVNLHMFDKFDRPYQLPSLELIKKRYDNHNSQHYAGNSCKTVPQILSPSAAAKAEGVGGGVQCDILHGSSLCKSDNIDLVEHSPCGVLLTTTAMNSLTDDVVYFGPNGQWTQLQKRGCIRDITCFEEEPHKLDRTYIFNKDGATISHKFCFAVTTGKCQKKKKNLDEGGDANAADTTDQSDICDNPLAKFTEKHLNLSQLCKSYQVPVPN